LGAVTGKVFSELPDADKDYVIKKVKEIVKEVHSMKLEASNTR